MPIVEKITVNRSGVTGGADGISNNPPLATLTDNVVNIVWGDNNYSIATDSEKLLSTRYEILMPAHLIGIFIPTAPYLSGGAEALIFRPTIVKDGDTLYVTAINYSGSSAFNVAAGSLIGKVIFVEGKSVLST